MNISKKDKEAIEKLHLAFIGRPGAGKGTQINLIKKEFNFIVIPSPGEIYRDPEFRKTEKGKLVASLVDQGKFAPDEITNQIMKEKILNLTNGGRKGFISEGYPRTIKQIKFAEKEIRIDYLINLNVSEKEVIKRLSGRRICPQCKKIYHLTWNPPKKDLLCDKDGVSLVQREDDKPENIKNRLRIYYQTAEPAIKYFREKGKVIDVDGEKEPKEVLKEIITKLQAKL